MKYPLSILFDSKWKYLVGQGCTLVNDEIVGGVFKRNFQCETSAGKYITGVINEFGRVEWHSQEKK
jgi:hypothetical protein